MAKITAPAVRIEQDGRPVFLTRFAVSDFMDPGFYRVERLRAKTPAQKKEAGYQRELLKRRARDFADYIQGPDVILPTSVLLAAEGELKFSPAKRGGGAGDIVIGAGGSKERPLFYMVDGQHRVEGLKMAAMREGHEHLRNFPVAAVVVSGLDKVAQMVQFWVVNTTQKKVPVALAQEILAQFTGMAEVEKTRGMPKSIRDVIEVGLDHKALELVKHLNDSPSSPWRGRIGMANTDPDKFKFKSSSIVTSLKRHMLVEGHPLALQPDPQTRRRMLENYWRAIVACVLEEGPPVDLKKLDSPLFKTAGVEIFHQASMSVFSHLAKDREYYVDSFRRCLDAASDLIAEDYAGVFSPEWWKAAGALSNEPLRKAAAALSDAVDGIEKKGKDDPRPFQC